MQLRQLELDELEPGGAFAAVHPQPIELLAQRRATVANARATVLLAVVKAGPGVEQRQVLARIEQLLVFVLAMQFDQPVGEVLECAGGGQRSGDEGPAAALRGDFAADDDLLPPSVFEDGFDGGQLLAGADQILRGAAAEEEPDGFDEDGFAGAGLARQDVERLFKVDGDRLDDRQVANGEIANHKSIVSWV